MSAPWQQHDDEPDDAYAAFLEHYRLRRHLETSHDALLAMCSGPEWTELWDWDQRCAAWDAETQRRRAVTAGQAMNVAANNLVMMASAHLSLALDGTPGSGLDEEGDDSGGDDLIRQAELLRSLRETLAAGCSMFEQTMDLVQSNTVSVPAPQPPRFALPAAPETRAAATAAAAARITAGRRQDATATSYSAWRPQNRPEPSHDPRP